MLSAVALCLLGAAGGAAEEAREDTVRQEEAREDTVRQEKKGLSSTLSRAGQLTGTEQTLEVVRWMSKRRQLTLGGVPYGFTGLPFVYLSPNTGWNYGFKLHWLDYQRRPYRYKMTLYLLRSTKGSRNLTFRIKVPRISGTGFGVVLLSQMKRDLRARYYGRGNDTEFNEALVDPASPDFIDENYYLYVLDRPQFIFSLLRHIRGPVSASVGLGLERTDVEKRGEKAFYRDEKARVGAVEGFTGFISATLHWDTRDDEAIPRRGVFHEWSYETSRNSLLGLLFEELIDFRRYTFTDARYVPLSARLNLAHRTVFEVLKGSVSLYAYGEIGGSQRVKGLGGSDSLRGFDTQRFTDNVRFFSNTEVRYHLYTMRLAKQHLEWHGVGFVDSGRVWPDLDEVSPGGLHGSGGVGLRVYWNAEFVIRADVGFSAERSYLALKYRNIF